MEAAWITKNYGDDLYLQCTYTCIRVLDMRLADACNSDKSQWKLPGSRRTMVTICTYNARTLASEFSIGDLLMHATVIRYDVIGLAETRWRHPFNAVSEIGEELFFGTHDSGGVDGVGVIANTCLSMNVDSFEQLTTESDD
uniref:Endonuclease/exonuclease/phosphatase n=1 Tax=Angiostrongylus cantonensis TaxID=6313 RepID=A0A0K0DIV7_ANGCA